VTIEILLQPKNQRFTLTYGGVNYRCTLVWHEADLGGWAIDIADNNDVPLVSGLPLVTGADLLRQHRHLGFRFGLVVASDEEVDRPPTRTSLGISTRLYLVPDV
jgi:hypothetical protein